MLISKGKQFYYYGVLGEFVYGYQLKLDYMLEKISGKL
jgi:hypothetical protein